MGNNLPTLGKHSCGQGVDPVHTPVARKVNVQSMMKTAKAQGKARLPNFHHAEVRVPARTSQFSCVDAWKKTVLADNLRDLHNTATCFNTGRIKITVDMAVADAGATGHFVLPGTPVVDVLPTSNPISIHLPDGGVMKSTHTCRINIPWLLERETIAHIVSGLAHTSLISIAVLCNAGYKVAYDGDECKVYFEGEIVWRGNRESSTKL